MKDAVLCVVKQRLVKLSPLFVPQAFVGLKMAVGLPHEAGPTRVKAKSLFQVCVPVMQVLMLEVRPIIAGDDKSGGEL